MRFTKLKTEANIKTNPWTSTEDEFVVHQKNLQGKHWSSISQRLNQLFYKWKKVRSPRQVRERWLNFLNPDLFKGPWTIQEEILLVRGHSKYGNQWSKIAAEIPSRNENQAKNHWTSINRNNRMYEIMLHLNDDFLKDNAGNSERDTDDLSFLNTEDSDWHMLMH